MSKLSGFVLNHKKAFAVSASVVVAAAALGCGAFVGFKAGEKSNRLQASNYIQPDVNEDSQNVTVGGVLTDETIKVDNYFAGISADEAKDIALRDAGFTAGEVTIVKSETEVDDGVTKHEIEFINGEDKYEYEIDANTSEILLRELEHEYELMTEKLNQLDKPGLTNPTSAPISLDEAKAIALADAGLTDAVFTKAKLDHDDNNDIYEIEFYSGATEYEYELSVYGGSILKKDVEFADLKTAVGGQDIGLEAAKEAAVKDAGLNYADINFTKAKKDTDDGILVYEIEFSFGDVEYDYEINASTGGIIKRENKYTTKYDDINTAVNAFRQIDSIKDIVLTDAGVKAADATFTKTVLHRNDGKDVFDIEFYTSDSEYEYEIDAVSGKIIKKESERRKGSASLVNTGVDIGVEDAKLVALKHCGLSASDVVFTTAKKDCDDGVDCYELEFCTPEHEYEYEIHCSTGEILHNECHKHDRDDNDCGHHRNHH